MSPLNITQPLDSIRYMVYNGYYKVMFNIPKMGHLPTPDKWRLSSYPWSPEASFFMGRPFSYGQIKLNSSEFPPCNWCPTDLKSFWEWPELAKAQVRWRQNNPYQCRQTNHCLLSFAAVRHANCYGYFWVSGVCFCGYHFSWYTFKLYGIYTNIWMYTYILILLVHTDHICISL